MPLLLESKFEESSKLTSLSVAPGNGKWSAWLTRLPERRNSCAKAVVMIRKLNTKRKYFILFISAKIPDYRPNQYLDHPKA